MTTKEVMFDSVEDVKRFVQQSEKQPEDIDVCCGSCMVDGKSILGILSLGIHKKLNVVIHDFQWACLPACTALLLYCRFERKVLQ